MKNLREVNFLGIFTLGRVWGVGRLWILKDMKNIEGVFGF